MSPPARPSSSESSSLSPTPKRSPLSPPQTILRPQQERRLPTYLQDYECDQVIITFFAGEPQTFQEVTKDERWIEVMNEDIRMIEKNNTWQLVDKPQDKEVIRLKWIYRIKYNEDDSIQKYKAV